MRRLKKWRSLSGNCTGARPASCCPNSATSLPSSPRPRRARIPLNKAIVGEHVFTHESGIHVDGLLKDQRTYQSLDPVLFGRSNRIVIGKHSGLSAITSLLDDLQLSASSDELRGILARVREHAVYNKGPVARETVTRDLARGLRPQASQLRVRPPCPMP